MSPKVLQKNIPRRQHRVKEQYRNQLKNIEIHVQCRQNTVLKLYFSLMLHGLY